MATLIRYTKTSRGAVVIFEHDDRRFRMFVRGFTGDSSELRELARQYYLRIVAEEQAEEDFLDDARIASNTAAFYQWVRRERLRPEVQDPLIALLRIYLEEQE
jgi:hypothetical protein